MLQEPSVRQIEKIEATVLITARYDNGYRYYELKRQRYLDRLSTLYPYLCSAVKLEPELYAGTIARIMGSQRRFDERHTNYMLVISHVSDVDFVLKDAQTITLVNPIRGKEKNRIYATRIEIPFDGTTILLNIPVLLDGPSAGALNGKPRAHITKINKPDGIRPFYSLYAELA